MKAVLRQTIIIVLFLEIFSASSLYGQNPRKQKEVIDWSYGDESNLLQMRWTFIDFYGNIFFNRVDLGMEFGNQWQTEQWDTLRKATLLETEMMINRSDSTILKMVESSFDDFRAAADTLWQEEMTNRINEHGNELRITDEVRSEIIWIKLLFTSDYARCVLNNYLILKEYGEKKK